MICLYKESTNLFEINVILVYNKYRQRKLMVLCGKMWKSHIT